MCVLVVNLVVMCVFDFVVEQAEPIVVAVVQQLVEFALCYLEKSIKNDDCVNFQVGDY